MSGGRFRRALAVAALGLIYSWVVAYWRPFTLPMYAATAVPIVVALVVAWRNPPAERREPTGEGGGRAVWVTLFVLLTSWELVAYFSSPRQDHPTLSTVADNVMSSHPGRAATFALWLAFGSLLFVRSRVPQEVHS
jgi:hypothetical protein